MNGVNGTNGVNGHSKVGFDVSGLVPAPVTPFNEDGSVDYDAIHRLGSWLGSIDGVKGLVVLGHAGEGTFLTQQEQVDVIKAFAKSVDYKVPIIAGITCEGTEVAALEAKRAKEAGAAAGLLYPSHGWLRFGRAAHRAVRLRSLERDRSDAGAARQAHDVLLARDAVRAGPRRAG